MGSSNSTATTPAPDESLSPAIVTTLIVTGVVLTLLVVFGAIKYYKSSKEKEEISAFRRELYEKELDKLAEHVGAAAAVEQEKIVQAQTARAEYEALQLQQQANYQYELQQMQYNQELLHAQAAQAAYQYDLENQQHYHQYN